MACVIDPKKRIMSDIRKIVKGNFEKERIYTWFDQEDIYHARAMLIGPEDTPYHNGYYFFDIRYPKNYPISPPQFKYMTLDNAWRANPNLYKDGKVCVSLLNTWQGPQWTACHNLGSVLVAVQSLILGVKHPIQNEPGWESETGNKSRDYNRLLEYHNLRVAVIKMILDTPYGFECFKTPMIDHFMENRFGFMKYIESIKKLDKKVFSSRIYSMSYKFNVKNLEEGMNTIYDKYIDAYNKKCINFENNVNDLNNVNNKDIYQEQTSSSSTSNQEQATIPNLVNNIASSIVEAKSNSGKRKCPKYAAKLYDLNHEEKGANGTDIYKVVLGNTGKKRWVKIN